MAKFDLRSFENGVRFTGTLYVRIPTHSEGSSSGPHEA